MMKMNDGKVAAIPVPPVRQKEKKLKSANSEEAKEIREMAKTFRKAADVVDRMAKIAEDDVMSDEQKEEGLEEAQASFILQMMKIQRIAGSI